MKAIAVIMPQGVSDFNAVVTCENAEKAYIMVMREIKGTAFGQRLQTLLDEAGVSQRELARRTGIRQQSISEYILEGQVPRFNNLVKIAAALHMSIFDLLGYSPAEIMDELSKH